MWANRAITCRSTGCGKSTCRPIRGAAGRLSGPRARRLVLARGGGARHFAGAGVEPPGLCRQRLPFPRNEPFIEHRLNEVASYRRDFTVPAYFAGRRLLLNVGAAGAAYYLWVNGQKIGYSEDSKLPTEFDISRAARLGKNTIAIELYRHADGSYLEDQDFWRVNGIERSITLYAAPQTHIRDLEIDAGLTHDYRDGTLSAQVDLAGRRRERACARPCSTASMLS